MTPVEMGVVMYHANHHKNGHLAVILSELRPLVEELTWGGHICKSLHGFSGKPSCMAKAKMVYDKSM